MKKRLLLLILGLCGTLGAQTTTTITGTIKDLTQALVTSGKVTFTLQPSKDTTISGLARFSPAQVVCLINASGLIKAQDGTSVCTVTMNTALQPPGSYYRVDLWPYNVKTSSFTFYAVLSTYDWSTVVPTPTTSPAQNFVDIFSNQTIGGAKIFTGNLTLTGKQTVPNQNNIVYVDGVTYAFTGAGIQAAINAACNGTVWGSVVITPGTISLGTTGLSVPNKCDVGGMGQSATTLQLSASAATTHFVNAAASPSNIRIHDLTLDGGSGTSLSEGCIGMNQVSAPQDITIDRVTCQNVGASGFNVTGTASNPGNRIKVLHSKVINAGLGTGGQIYGILVSFDRHAAVLDNEISGGGVTTGVAAFSSVNASSGSAIADIQIVGNRIHDLTYNAMTGGAIDAGRATQVVVSDNIIWNLAQGGCVTLESVWGGTISGNSCSVADVVLTGGPILVKIPDATQAGEVASQDIAITGNTIIDNSLVATTNAGIAVNGAARNIAIVGNSISYLNQPSSGAYGIYLQLGTADANIAAATQNFCNAFSVTGNTIVGRAGASGAVLNGIGIQQVATACVVDQVTVDNNTVNGVNAGIAVFSAAASNGITHLYVHDNPVEGNTIGLSTDGKTYASFFYWNNNPPNGSGLQINNLPPITTKFNAGISNDGPGFKHKRVTGCTTGSVSGNNCETTVTWTTAFADANYTPVCTLLGTATLGHLGAISTSAIAAASVKVQTVTDTAAAITGTINCIAVHD